MSVGLASGARLLPVAEHSGDDVPEKRWFQGWSVGGSFGSHPGLQESRGEGSPMLEARVESPGLGEYGDRVSHRVAGRH